MVLSKREYIGGGTWVIRVSQKKEEEQESLCGCNLLRNTVHKIAILVPCRGAGSSASKRSYSPGTIWKGKKALLAANRAENA